MNTNYTTPDSWIQSAANGMCPDTDDHDEENESGLTMQERQENFEADRGEALFKEED